MLVLWLSISSDRRGLRTFKLGTSRKKSVVSASILGSTVRTDRCVTVSSGGSVSAFGGTIALFPASLNFLRRPGRGSHRNTISARRSEVSKHCAHTPIISPVYCLFQTNVDLADKCSSPTSDPESKYAGARVGRFLSKFFHFSRLEPLDPVTTILLSGRQSRYTLRFRDTPPWHSCYSAPTPFSCV